MALSLINAGIMFTAEGLKSAALTLVGVCGYGYQALATATGYVTSAVAKAHDAGMSVCYSSQTLELVRLSFTFGVSLVFARSVIRVAQAVSVHRHCRKVGKVQYMCDAALASIVRRSVECVAWGCALGMVVFMHCGANSHFVLGRTLALWQLLARGLPWPLQSALSGAMFHGAGRSPTDLTLLGMLVLAFVFMSALLLGKATWPHVDEITLAGIRWCRRMHGLVVPYLSTPADLHRNDADKAPMDALPPSDQQAGISPTAFPQALSDKYAALGQSHRALKRKAVQCSFHCGTTLVFPPNKAALAAVPNPDAVAVLLHDHSPVCASCMNMWLTTTFNDRLGGVYNNTTAAASSSEVPRKAGSGTSEAESAFHRLATACVVHDCAQSVTMEDLHAPGISPSTVRLYEKLLASDACFTTCPKPSGCGRTLYAADLADLQHTQRIAAVTNGRHPPSCRQVQCGYADCGHYFCRACFKDWSAHDADNGFHCPGERKLTAEQALLQLRTATQAMFKKGIRACPGCYTVIERTTGCNHMTHHCSYGKRQEFCYACNGALPAECNQSGVCKPNLSYLQTALTVTDRAWMLALEKSQRIPKFLYPQPETWLGTITQRLWRWSVNGLRAAVSGGKVDVALAVGHAIGPAPSTPVSVQKRLEIIALSFRKGNPWEMDSHLSAALRVLEWVWSGVLASPTLIAYSFMASGEASVSGILGAWLVSVWLSRRLGFNIAVVAAALFPPLFQTLMRSASSVSFVFPL